VVYDIATSPLTDGLIWRTTDDGAHWQNVTPPALQPWSKVGIIEPSHFDPDTAYAAIDRHRVDDQRPYILRTRDGGRTWEPIIAGLPQEGGPNSVNVVREDPVQRGLLFAGTERGAFVSFDDGDSWQPLASGLPTTSVRDITIHGNDVVIATHGRGFYVLDDIQPLRALAVNAVDATRLYPLAAAVRLNEPGFTGTPMPKDEPLAPNPPFGAMIDYSLAAPAPVEIAIFDCPGWRVTRYTRRDPVKPIDLSTLPIAPEWVTAPKPPLGTTGHHRFVWNLHYAKAAGLKDSDTPAGVWASPGRYMVELTVGGRHLRQPLDVIADPRVHVSQADFQAQFRLARQIEAARVRVRTMLEQADDLKTRIAKSDRQPLALQLAGFVGEDSPIGGANAPTTLKGISGWLDKLADAVDGADAAPTPDNVRGFETVLNALNTMEPRWKQFAAATAAQLPPA
jgi:hypothetical protein